MSNFTKEAIKASFMKLLNEQPLNKISVRSISEDCGINRNSFYYHFENIPDLIESIITDRVDFLVKKYPTINSIDECFNVAFERLLENKKAVLHIYNSVNRDIYERYTLKICEYVVSSYVTTVFTTSDISENDRKILIKFFKCQLFGMCIEWISTGMNNDAISEFHRLMELCHGLTGELIKRSKTKKP